MIRVIRQEEISSQFYEKGNPKQITIPEMSEPVSDMLKRFRRGELPFKQSVYNMDEELPNLKKMDLVDVDNFKREINQTITNGKSKKKSLEKELQNQRKETNPSNDNGDI